MPKSKNVLLDVETYIEAATYHGECSDPEHEVGDLQDYLRRAWELMSAEQRMAFAKDQQNQEMVRDNTPVDALNESSFSLSDVEAAIDALR